MALRNEPLQYNKTVVTPEGHINFQTVYFQITKVKSQKLYWHKQKRMVKLRSMRYADQLFLCLTIRQLIYLLTCKFQTFK